MGIPQIIIIVLFAISLGVNMSLHGKPQTGKHNFFVTLFNVALIFGLLIWGGFFK